MDWEWCMVSCMEPTSLPIPSPTPELVTKFNANVPDPDLVSGCQYWTGGTVPSGYGVFYVSATQKMYRAHRVAYAWKYGDPGEAVLDHTCHDPLTCVPDENGWCRHRLCVNPDHLEPTTRGENVRRGLPGSPLWNPAGNSYKQKCLRGHEFTPENTYVNPRGERQCRKCLRSAVDRYREANREKINAQKRVARVKVTYDERPCQCCGLPFTPKRSTGVFCQRRDCINMRQKLNRQGRLRDMSRGE